MRLWLAFSMCCLTAVGQSTARIEGHVLSQSGEAVRKATVRLSGALADHPLTYIEVSDSTGKFIFDELPPGRYSLSAGRTGYTTAKLNGSSSSTITVRAGEVKRDAEFRLVQLGVISGRVTDQDGDPVIGVQVQAMHMTYNGARRQLSPYATVSSDDQGNFRMANVEPGRYYPMVDDLRRLSSGGAGWDERRGRSALEVDVTTFYPSAPDWGSALAVDVAAGGEVQSINIRMLRARVFTLSGKLVDGRTGQPAGGQVTLTPRANSVIMANARIGAPAQPSSGAFQFHGLLPGAYLLQVQVMQVPGPVQPQGPRAATTKLTELPQMSVLAGRLDVSVANSDVDALVVSLSPQAEITGTVRLEDGDLQMLRGATILLTDTGEGFGGSTPAQIDADGTFRIANLGFLRYAVNMNPKPPGTYVKSMRFGGQDVTKSSLDLTSGAGGALDIVLSRKAAEVTGVVHSTHGENVSGMTVSIWPKTGAEIDLLGRRTYRTDSNGSAKLTELPPGEYFIAAWEEVDQSLLLYPDFLARFNDQATAVKLAENDKITTDLTLIPKDKITAETAKLP